jgi:hypothetical protein
MKGKTVKGIGDDSANSQISQAFYSTKSQPPNGENDDSGSLSPSASDINGPLPPHNLNILTTHGIPNYTCPGSRHLSFSNALNANTRQKAGLTGTSDKTDGVVGLNRTDRVWLKWL